MLIMMHVCTRIAFACSRLFGIAFGNLPPVMRIGFVYVGIRMLICGHLTFLCALLVLINYSMYVYLIDITSVIITHKLIFILLSDLLATLHFMQTARYDNICICFCVHTFSFIRIRVQRRSTPRTGRSSIGASVFADLLAFPANAIIFAAHTLSGRAVRHNVCFSLFRLHSNMLFLWARIVLCHVRFHGVSQTLHLFRCETISRSRLLCTLFLFGIFLAKRGIVLLWYGRYVCLCRRPGRLFPFPTCNPPILLWYERFRLPPTSIFVFLRNASFANARIYRMICAVCLRRCSRIFRGLFECDNRIIHFYMFVRSNRFCCERFRGIFLHVTQLLWYCGYIEGFRIYGKHLIRPTSNLLWYCRHLGSSRIHGCCLAHTTSSLVCGHNDMIRLRSDQFRGIFAVCARVLWYCRDGICVRMFYGMLIFYPTSIFVCENGCVCLFVRRIRVCRDHFRGTYALVTRVLWYC